MERLQVLLVTMNREDISIAKTANISCGAVIANQANREAIETVGNLKMITTKSRGVGLNRNIALLASDAEIVLFGDDDLVYNDDMPESVIAAFQANPDADVILFGLEMSKDGQVYETRRPKNHRVRIWQAMRFGTCRIAARRRALVQHGIMFNQNFGGGCPFSSGEDSLFLKACFDKGLKVYSNEYILGTCAKDSSTWFAGYGRKYFYDKGVLMRYLFPKIPRLMTLYFGIRFKRETDLGAVQRVRWMLRGVSAGKNMVPYEARK